MFVVFLKSFGFPFDGVHELQDGEVEFDASLGARSFHVVAQNIGHDFPAFLHERLLFEFFVGIGKSGHREMK